MEDGVLSPATMLGVPSDSAMDLDFMDELFLDGWCLETREANDFLSQAPSTSFIPSNNPNTSLFDPLFPWPSFDHNAELNSSTPISQDQQSLPKEAQPNTDLARSVWIAPKRIGADSEPSPTSAVIDRLCRALNYIQDVIRNKSVLVQIWVPVNQQGKRVLVTSDLPFALDNSCPSLVKYRDVSATYRFSIEDDKGNDPEGSRDMKPGLPGRVFSGKVPEWTPDVRFFRNDEYPRLSHARKYHVCGTLALPVFERGSRNCLGVVEIVMTTQNIKCRPELESVCKALEAVDLKSNEVLGDTLNVYNKHYQTVMPEIQEVLRHACNTHRLPLAQTWVPCSYQGKEGCRHSDENFGQCVSTVDYACHVADPRVQGFHEACSEHHLLRGQGVVGSAFATNQPCFSEDVTTYSKTEYPLSHHAAVFRMRAAVAIRLRSTHTGSADFVLEFFLPLDCVDPEEQRRTLTSLSLIIQQCCRTLRVVAAEELEEEEDERHQGSSAPPAVEDEVEVKPGKVVASVLDSMEACSVIGEASFSSKAGSGERRRTKAEKNITLEVLRQYFAGSLKDAAKSIGVCSTTLKRICRQHGIKRWPSRKIKKVGHSLQKLQLVIDSVQGASGAFQIDSFYSNFPELASPNISNTSHFSASKLHHQHPKNRQPPPPELEPQPNNNEVQATSKSSSSCSQSSSSSQCCTSRSDQNTATLALKRVRSEAVINKEENEDDEGDDIMAKKTIIPRSHSQKSLIDHHRRKMKITSSDSHHNMVAANNDDNGNNSGSLRPKGDEFQRVKVTFGDEKTRFRMHRSWGYADLQREIASRFGIKDMGVFTIKYLDDDSEWVLLTCEADLEECFEVCRTCQTIKLSIHVSRAFVSGTL